MLKSRLVYARNKYGLRCRASPQALQANVDLDLDDIQAITPPRGFGRD